MSGPAIEYLAAHLSSVFHDGAWTAVGVREAFHRLDAKRAAARPVGSAHSAWEILLHIDAWHRAVARRLDGEAVTLSGADDWRRPTATTDGHWQDALTQLDTGFQSLLGAVRRYPAERLQERLPDNEYTALQTIHGVAEHDLYHAGQVALLAWAMPAEPVG